MQRTALIALISVVATAALIYLTPLKHLNVIAPEPRDITPTKFWAEYQKNPDKYLFYDVRGKDAYATVHASGSTNVPIGDLFNLRRALPKSGKTIVLICTSGSLAGVAYGFLEHWGHTNLLRVEGGLRQWIVEGLPVEGNNTAAPLPEKD